MTSHPRLRHPKSQPAFLPLAVRNSTLCPFNFDPAEAMAELEHKVTLSGSPGRSISEGVGTRTGSGLGSESHELAKMLRSNAAASSVTLGATHTASSVKSGETLRPIEPSLPFTTPSQGGNTGVGLQAFSGSCASTVTPTPSKNNFRKLIKELEAAKHHDKTKGFSSSTVNVAAMPKVPKPSAVQHLLATPKKRHNFAILSPSRTIQSFTTATHMPRGKRSTFRDQHDGNEVVGELEFLATRPAPDPSQHPAMAADPFTSKSAAPILSTPMTVSQSRQWAIEHYHNKKKRWMESQVRPFVKGEPFPVFKQPEWISKDEAMMAEQTKLAAAAAATAAQDEKKDLGKSKITLASKKNNGKTPKTSLQIDTNTANGPKAGNGTLTQPKTRPPTPHTLDVFKKVDKKVESAKARSFSNFFKIRTSTDKDKSRANSSMSANQANASAQQIKEDTMAAKERYLRSMTNCPSVAYSPTSVYPRHPHTGREWGSRNLRCAGCEWTTCSVCGRACCARAACFYAIENHKDNSPGLQRAQETKAMIEILMPNDAEVQTFLECASCKKQVCPDCCGICPNQDCQDIQCRRCKRGDPWDECEWHKAQTIQNELDAFGFRAQTSLTV